MTDAIPVAAVRLDVWLWAARFYRTRSLAKQAVETGKVDVAGQRPKSSRAVRVGEALQISRGDEVFDIQVLGLSDIPKPADAADALAIALCHAWKGPVLLSAASGGTSTLTPAQRAWAAAEKSAGARRVMR